MAFLPLEAQEILPIQARFHHFTTADGLSNSWISDIHQDRYGFMWFATQYGLNRFDGSGFTYFTYAADDTSGLAANWVLNIAEGIEDRLWIGTYCSGLSSYHLKTHKFTKHFYNYEQPVNSILRNVNTTFIDSSGCLWMGTSLVHTQRYDIKKDQLTDFHILKNLDLTDIVEDSDNIWLGTKSGLYRYHKESDKILKVDGFDQEIRALGRVRDYLLLGMDFGLLGVTLDLHSRAILIDTLVHTAFVNDIEVDHEQIWIAGKEGLSVYSLRFQTTSKFIHDAANPHSVFEGELISLKLDRERNLWIGGQKGLCVLYADRDKFEYSGYHPQIKKHRGVRGIASTREFIWVGADDGLWRYSKFHFNDPPVQIFGTPVTYVLVTRDGFIYTGGRDGTGLFRIDPDNFKVKRWTPKADDPTSISTGSIWFLEEDNDGGIIISATHSLDYLSPNSDRFIHIKKLLPPLTQEPLIHLPLLLDRENRLWVGTIQGGIVRINWRLPDHPFNKSEIKTYTYDYTDPTSLSNDAVLFIFEGNAGDIWICTDGGFDHYDPKQDGFVRHSRSSGLKDDKLLAATEDSEGKIWFSTISHGILAYDPKSAIGTYYQEADGIYHDAFLLHVAHTTEEGIMLFANEKGVQVFNPLESNLDTVALPPIYFTGLRLNNQAIDVSVDGPLVIAPEYTTHLNLTPEQNNLALSYAIPHFNKLNKYTFKYQLAGSSNEWVKSSDLSDISFANLNPGVYTLTIEACLAEQCRRSTPLIIDIGHPWWATSLAYFFYFISICLLFYQFYKFKIKRKLQKQEQLHRDEVHETKNRFFTNITHEFRTPLTLISGPLERLIKSPEINNPEIKSALSGIRKNADHLLSLINNVLDLSRLEAGLMPVNLINTELSSFIKSIIDAFQSYAYTRQINIFFVNHCDDFSAMIDREKIRIILSNLLSNAIKFSQNGTLITVDLDIDLGMSTYFITVTDQGKGINTEDKVKIFDRFYRVAGSTEEGTGLGLSLV
ncbi:MAG: hypothetical protein HKN76_08025, partial [Saprospiraceae bacterium]|nr:hypothetical protein [Saprospiraceae bacterium]